MGATGDGGDGGRLPGDGAGVAAAADPAFDRALDDCRLALCVQWLGWSPRWSPPAEHFQDWLALAVRLAEARGW